MAATEENIPKSTSMARQFLSSRTDWVSPDSPYYGKTYDEMIAPPYDPVQMRQTGPSVIHREIAEIHSIPYMIFIQPLIEQITNILPDFRALDDFNLISTVHRDPHKVFPALEEFIRDHPDHDAAKPMRKMLHLLQDYEKRAYNPSLTVSKAATNLHLLGASEDNKSIRPMASVKKMRAAQQDMETLRTFFAEILDHSNKDVSPDAWDNPNSDFAKSGRQLGEMVDVLQTMHDDLGKVIEQVERERAPMKGSSPPPPRP